jgi:hypothetical protein
MIREGVVMGKVILLKIYASARKRVEQGNLDIAAQNEVIIALERQGLDATMARAILVKIITQLDADLDEMECLLTEADPPVSTVALGGHDGIQEVTTENTSIDVAD